MLIGQLARVPQLNTRIALRKLCVASRPKQFAAGDVSMSLVSLFVLAGTAPPATAVQLPDYQGWLSVPPGTVSPGSTPDSQACDFATSIGEGIRNIAVGPRNH